MSLLRPRLPADRCSDGASADASLALFGARLGVDQALDAAGIDSTDGTSEVHVGQRPKGFATQHEFSRWLLHGCMITQRSWPSHASITCSELGSVHLESSPEKPRVTMSRPSM